MAASRKPPSPRRPSDLEIHAELEKTRIKTIGWTIVGSFIGLSILTLSAVPLAHQIAGKRTDVEVNITLSLSIAFAFTTAIGSGFAVVYRRINKRLRRRNRDLEGELLKVNQRVTDLEGELGDAHGRIQDLQEGPGP